MNRFETPIVAILLTMVAASPFCVAWLCCDEPTAEAQVPVVKPAVVQPVSAPASAPPPLVQVLPPEQPPVAANMVQTSWPALPTLEPRPKTQSRWPLLPGMMDSDLVGPVPTSCPGGVCAVRRGTAVQQTATYRGGTRMRARGQGRVRGTFRRVANGVKRLFGGGNRGRRRR